MKLAMISQPMGGLSETEILDTRNKAIKYLESLGYDVIESYFDNGYFGLEALENIGVVNVPLFYLAKSIEQMSKCTTIYFCDGWENARGCIIEHGAAKVYELNILYENSDSALNLR